MSDVQARPAASRGRGSGRGGRGGLAGRGGRSGGRPNGHSHAHDKAESKTETDNPSAFDDDDQGAIGELKKLYGSKTPLIKEMFPDWSEVDILFALQETDGDETEAATRIAEGTISQWGEVSKSKKVPRSKAKDSTAAASATDSPMSTSKPARGGRHVSEGGRGRGRTSERGGRGGRGRTSHTTTTNGPRANKEDQRLSVPTEESTAWDAKPNGAEAIGETAPAKATTVPDSTTNDVSASTPAPSTGPKTWASMLRQSTAPKAPPKPKEAPAPKPTETIEPLPPAVPSEPEPQANAEPKPEPASQADEPQEEAAPKPQEEESTTAEVPTTVVEPEVALPPSQDQLTETNLEQVDDVSHPPATQTVASTAADSWDPRFNSASATATPLSASQHQHQAAARAAAAATAIPAAPASGYAASALKATTGGTPRTPSFQRRVLDQEEAVRMPGNREVDRAAVQFGAFSLGGDEDIDGDREEPETRAQPPADSPVTHPRASLPPAAPQPAVPDAFGEQKTGPAAATPAVAGPTSAAAPAAATPASATTAAPQAAPGSQAPQSAPQGPGQYSRFGQPTTQDAASFGQKPVDPFAQQIPASSAQGQLDGFPNQPTQQQQQPNQPQQQQAQAQQQQPQQQAQQQGQQPGGAYSSAPGEYSSYYTSDQHGRAPYSYYGQPYGQQGGQGQQQQQQDALPGQQRAFGGYNANASQADNISQYPQSGTLHNQTRYGGAVSSDAQNSGHTTPNPTTQSQQQQQATAAAGQGSQPQAHGQQNYPYGSHPYYNNPYYSNYMGYGGHFGQQGGYGAPYGKAGMYAPYGMSPQGPYEHASSPASGFGAQSALHRGADSALGSGLGGDYGRAGSGQATNPAGLGGSGFGIQDSFARGGSSSFPTQSAAGQGYNASAQASTGGSANDDLKPFGEGKTGVSGPSPSLGGARPGSATQNTPASQSGLPPPQSSSQMGGYGGYPSHLQGHGVHGGSGYGMGASGQHGNAGFGSYGQGYGSGYYGGSGQQRGWGGNYH